MKNYKTRICRKNNATQVTLFIETKPDFIPTDRNTMISTQTIRGKIEVPRDLRNSKSPWTWQVQERMVSTLEQMQDPNGTGPGVRNSKRPLLASLTRCKCPMETSRNKIIW